MLLRMIFSDPYTSSEMLPPVNCYAVVPGKFFAGEYSAAKVDAIVRHGVTHFADLTSEDDGLIPYEDLARRKGEELERRIEYRRFPIQNGGVPASDDVTDEILDFLDRCIETGGCVYLHCWGGIGRTGTLVGCFLIRHGFGADGALRRVEAYWQSTSKYNPYWTSPENERQKEYVRNWARMGEVT